MDFKPNQEIKNEKLTLVERLCFDDDINYLDFESSLINLKIENVLSNEDDWCIEEENFSSTFKVTSINYEELVEDQKQTCLICSKFFPNSFQLLQHNLKHLNVPLINRKVFICNYCLVYYSKKTELQVHISTDHQPQWKGRPRKFCKTSNLYDCKLCKKKKMPYKAWHEHMNNVHTKEKIKCDKCSQIFKCKRYLKRHILYIHQGVRPDWRFHKKQDIVISTDKVKCPLCPGVYTNKHALKTHNRNCHSLKTYKCKICESQLKSRAYLLAHMQRVHYDDGHVYSCETCGKKFKSPRYLNIHINNVHIKFKKMHRY